jgi:predicted DNA-binding transcriptional regulator AlpA
MDRSAQLQAYGLYSQACITDKGDFSKSHLYSLIAKGHFPKPIIRYGSRFTRWSASQVDAWLSDPQGWIDQNTAKNEGVQS